MVDKPGDPRDTHTGVFNLVNYNNSRPPKSVGIKMVESPKPPKDKPTPTKELRYHVTGANRDPLPLAARLGNQTNYNSYVDNLRGYDDTSAQLVQNDLILQSVRKDRNSPRRDHFTEGQVSIRSISVRNGLAVLQKQQKDFTCRLSQPLRGKSVDPADFPEEIAAAPRNYLKRNQ